MREIKFRAWDEQRNEFLSNGQILISIQPGCCPKSNPVYLDILQGADQYKDRFTLEQYTNIHDKNSKEIFEGDIVVARYEGEEDAIHQVVYKDNLGYPAFDLEPYPDCECNAISYYGQAPEASLEVIGNIHDNPELIGDTHEN